MSLVPPWTLVPADGSLLGRRCLRRRQSDTWRAVAQTPLPLNPLPLNPAAVWTRRDTSAQQELRWCPLLPLGAGLGLVVGGPRSAAARCGCFPDLALLLALRVLARGALNPVLAGR